MKVKQHTLLDLRPGKSPGTRGMATGSLFQPTLHLLVSIDDSRMTKEIETGAHDFHEIIYIARGKAVMEIDDQSHDATEGDAFLVNPGQAHRTFAPGGKSCFAHYVGFSCHKHWREHVRQAIGTDMFPCVLGKLGAEVLRLVSRLHDEAEDNNMFRLNTISMLVDLFLIRLLRHFSEETRPRKTDRLPAHPEVPARINEFVKTSLDRPVSVDEMAEHCFMSRTYFSKVFKQEVGESPARFVLKHKIHVARQMLENSNTKVAEIAHTLGFDDEYYFSKVFKRIAGVSPSQYRRVCD